MSSSCSSVDPSNNVQDEEGVVAVATNVMKCPAEFLNDEFDCSFAALGLVCIGLKNEEKKAIIDLNNDQWKSLQVLKYPHLQFWSCDAEMKFCERCELALNL